MDTRRDESVPMRKGPWMAEEDEILTDYVKKHGPRDWSSIRAKGLLPRTGKSCRLRWVNKLKPDLKTQKRLARTMQMPKSQKTNGKLPVFREADDFKVPRPSTVPFNQENSMGQSSQPSCTENSEDMKMVDLPDLISPNPLHMHTDCPSLEITPIDQNPYLEHPLPLPPPQLQFPFPQLPEPPPLGIPLPPEGQDLCQGFVDPIFSDVFGCHNPGSENDLRFPSGFPALELDTGQNGVKLEEKNPSTPDSFFDDFPTDMFDYLESLPSSSDW
ncbi:transcription factor DUO1-like [Aristolochia californica]|uniref:transcription factor DUO1-like n=1 Tax=Aristolochia californica TaxID=171875 RepID=UPI0035DAE028